MMFACPGSWIAIGKMFLTHAAHATDLNSSWSVVTHDNYQMPWISGRCLGLILLSKCLPAASKGLPMDNPTLLIGHHWTPIVSAR